MKTSQEILFLQNRFAYLQDEAAYRKLFFYFYPVLITFAQTILNNREDAEEAVSEVMLKIWTMGRELNYIENLTLYLHAATRNKAYDLLRKRNNSLTLVTLSAEAEQLAGGGHPEQELIFNELDHYFQNTINNLPKQCQLVFRLVKERGFTYKQVTEILGISKNTAETHMRLALKKIRTALDHYLVRKK